MKRILFLSMICLGLAAAIVQAGDEKPWLDPENCDMCTNMMAQPGLLEHMKMENLNVGSGMISLVTVDPEFQAAYATAYAGMQKSGEKMMAGEEMNLCGCCTDIGALMTAGAKMDNLPTANGSVMLLSSTDPKLVEKIHAHADRTNAEMAAMMESGHHDGHKH